MAWRPRSHEGPRSEGRNSQRHGVNRTASGPARSEGATRKAHAHPREAARKDWHTSTGCRVHCDTQKHHNNVHSDRSTRPSPSGEATQGGARASTMSPERRQAAALKKKEKRKRDRQRRREKARAAKAFWEAHASHSNCLGLRSPWLVPSMRRRRLRGLTGAHPRLLGPQHGESWWMLRRRR